MNHAELAGGFIASSEETLTVTPPTAKGGKPKDLKKVVDKYGLDVANDFLSQAISHLQNCKTIVDKVRRRIDYTLKDVD